MCTVPWSLDTQMREASWLKLMLQGERRTRTRGSHQVNQALLRAALIQTVVENRKIMAAMLECFYTHTHILWGRAAI